LHIANETGEIVWWENFVGMEEIILQREV